MLKAFKTLHLDVHLTVFHASFLSLFLSKILKRTQKKKFFLYWMHFCLSRVLEHLPKLNDSL